METILKWIKNEQVDADSDEAQNYVISRTMLKIAVISKFMLKDKRMQLPQDGELWRCRIVKETREGQNSGCIIVEPLARVDENDLVKLLPGTFDIKLVGRCLLVRPHAEYRGKNWILPLQHKKILAEEHKAYCLIVDLDSTDADIDLTDGHSMPKVHQ